MFVGYRLVKARDSLIVISVVKDIILKKSLNKNCKPKIYKEKTSDKEKYKALLIKIMRETPMIPKRSLKRQYRDP